MKNKIMFVFMALMTLGFSIPALAQDSQVILASEPQIHWTPENFLAVQPANTPSLLIYTYNGKAFPPGTQPRYLDKTNRNNEKEYPMEFQLPGKAWQKLMWSQLKCKDEACQAEPPPIQAEEPPEEPAKFKCKVGRAAGLGLLGGGIGFGLGSINSEANAGDAHAEVSSNPLLGAAVGAVVLPSIDCLVQYSKWKKAQRNKR